MFVVMIVVLSGPSPDEKTQVRRSKCAAAAAAAATAVFVSRVYVSSVSVRHAKRRLPVGLVLGQEEDVEDVVGVLVVLVLLVLVIVYACVCPVRATRPRVHYRCAWCLRGRGGGGIGGGGGLGPDGEDVCVRVSRVRVRVRVFCAFLILRPSSIQQVTFQINDRMDGTRRVQLG
jgi:hypothetical protein